MIPSTRQFGFSTASSTETWEEGDLVAWCGSVGYEWNKGSCWIDWYTTVKTLGVFVDLKAAHDFWFINLEQYREWDDGMASLTAVVVSFSFVLIRLHFGESHLKLQTNKDVYYCLFHSGHPKQLMNYEISQTNSDIWVIPTAWMNSLKITFMTSSGHPWMGCFDPSPHDSWRAGNLHKGFIRTDGSKEYEGRSDSLVKDVDPFLLLWNLFVFFGWGSGFGCSFFVSGWTSIHWFRVCWGWGFTFDGICRISPSALGLSWYRSFSYKASASSMSIQNEAANKTWQLPPFSPWP